MIESAELMARLTLRALPNLRDRNINRLIREHGSAAAALCAPTQIIELAGTLPDDAVRARVTRAQRVIDSLDINVLVPGDSHYPLRLRQRLRSACPSILFAIGDVSLLDNIGVAIVGSRNMTEYGRSVAEDFSRDLSHAGLCIISGLALGIDAAAHVAALDAGGDTVAVVGNGVDVIYPRTNAMLRERIIDCGVVVSQFLPGSRPSPWNFPERNLIMATLSEGVLVVEAGQRSGALITAHHAGDAGVDAMAVPGPIGRPGSIGSNNLIREGVACVTSVADVLDVMDRPGRTVALANQIADRNARRATDAETVAVAVALGDAQTASATCGDPERDDEGSDGRARSAAPRGGTQRHALRDAPETVAIRASLEAGVLHLDEVASPTRLPMSVILATLLQLELGGVVRQHAGSRFELRTHVVV